MALEIVETLSPYDAMTYGYAFYCDRDDRFFGPKFESREQAVFFWQYVGPDPRTIQIDALMDMWREFQKATAGA